MLREELPSLSPLTARHWFFIIEIFEQLSCSEKQFCPEIFNCIEIFVLFRIFEELVLARKTEFVMDFFAVFNILFTFRCFSNFCLPSKTECALNSLYWMYFLSFRILNNLRLPWKFSLHWNQDFWGCACPENRVFPEIFHCIEYSFYIQDFWATCVCHEKHSVPWIHCIEYIFFIIQNFEQPALALKFFTVLKYFLSFRIFEQLELALKTDFALNFSSRGGGRPPASYATGNWN